MPDRTRRRLRWSVAAGCCVVATIAASAACGSASGKPMVAAGVNASVSVRVLQMNLCDSGIATCYTGKAVATAAAVIRAERPDIVTLNEICRHDVAVLKQALSEAARGSVVTSAFGAALQQRTNEAFRCRNGQQYGIGLLVRIQPPARGFLRSDGHYPAQDPADTEARGWLCVHAITHFYACTTHLSSTSSAVAIDECRYLMNTVIPAVRERDRSAPVILGADFNLLDTQSPDPQSCIPRGFVRTDDGARQDIVASAPLRVTSSSTIDMHGSTDHPGLLADLVMDHRRQQ